MPLKNRLLSYKKNNFGVDRNKIFERIS